MYRSNVLELLRVLGTHNFGTWSQYCWVSKIGTSRGSRGRFFSTRGGKGGKKGGKEERGRGRRKREEKGEGGGRREEEREI